MELAQGSGPQGKGAPLRWVSVRDGPTRCGWRVRAWCLTWGRPRCVYSGIGSGRPAGCRRPWGRGFIPDIDRGRPFRRDRRPRGFQEDLRSLPVAPACCATPSAGTSSRTGPWTCGSSSVVNPSPPASRSVWSNSTTVPPDRNLWSLGLYMVFARFAPRIDRGRQDSSEDEMREGPRRGPGASCTTGRTNSSGRVGDPAGCR